MAIYAMSLGSKETGNADPATAFWAFLAAFRPTGTSNTSSSQSAVISGFDIDSAVGGTVKAVTIGGRDNKPDVAVIYDAENKRSILIAGDGTATTLTMGTDFSASSVIAVVAYIDRSTLDTEHEAPGTPGYVKIKAVGHTTTGAVTDGEITEALGENKPFVRLGEFKTTADGVDTNSKLSSYQINELEAINSTGQLKWTVDSYGRTFKTHTVTNFSAGDTASTVTLTFIDGSTTTLKLAANTSQLAFVPRKTEIKRSGSGAVTADTQYLNRISGGYSS